VSRGSFNQTLGVYRPVLDNILTFEVEDRFHVDNPDVEPADTKSRIIPLLLHLLDLLDEQKAKATFFVLGWVARKFPEVVSLIDSRGFEVGSHGFTHGDVRFMPKDKFESEIRRSKDILEEILGKPILGYKAPAPFLGRQHLPYFKIMANAGYRYDCSFLPENSKSESKKPFLVSVEPDKSIWAIPQSTNRRMGVMIRVGEYIRVLPGWFGLNSIKRLNEQGFPAMVNMKLWELDRYQARTPATELFKYSNFGNLSLAEEKLRHILDYFRFTSCSSQLKLVEHPASHRL
jgi:polysaccharide deacetylase family protein (PEP-CTERM system associated)